MADSYEKRRRRRGRDYRERESSFRDEYQSQNSQATKPPMKILGLAKPSKPSGDTSPSTKRNAGSFDTSSSPIIAKEGVDDQDKVSVTVLSSSTARNETNDNSSRAEARHSSATPLSDGTLPNNHSQHSKSRTTINPNAAHLGAGDSHSNFAGTKSKLAAPFEKQTKTKLIDDALQWLDAGFELMIDQNDFVVVGVVGLQGTGKSTILSLLAGNNQQDAYKNYIFTPQSKETKEECMFQTIGIDMFVTPDRIIYLDCQPLLSPSVMDWHLRHDRKIPSDCYSSLQNLVEMQSLQLLTFLFSVCNTVLIVHDWFIDVNLLRFIQDAEMLKPVQPSSDNSINKEQDHSEFFPNVVFVHNKASPEDFNPQNYHSMQNVLSSVLASSKFKYRTGINMFNRNNQLEPLINPLPDIEHQGLQDVNLILLPMFEYYKSELDCIDTKLPDYRGYPSFNTTFSTFRAQILGAQRSPLTHSIMSEKSWYHFAARIWDSVKKSALLAEYNRLLSA